MLRTTTALAFLAPAVFTACPSKPPQASLIEGDATDASVAEPDAMLDAGEVIELGFPALFQGTRMMDSNDLVGFPIQVTASQAGELVGWGIKLASSPPLGAQVRMAIYTNDNTLIQPAVPLRESGTWDLVDAVLPLNQGYLLNAGSYWLLVSVSQTISISSSMASPAESRECFRALVFTTPFPNPWGTGSCSASNPVNIYIRIRPAT